MWFRAGSVRVLVRPNDFDSARRYIRDTIELDSTEAWEVEIDGAPGVAVEMGTDQLGSNPGGIQFFHSETVVSITGDGYTVEDLMPVAETMATR